MNLPTELILDQLLLLSFKDLNNYCFTNSNIQNVCNEYEDLIYTNLLKKDFILLKPKLLYKLFLFETHNNDNSILLKQNHFNIWKKAIDKNNIKKLISFNLLDINVQNNKGITPLMYSLKKFDNNNINIIDSIIKLNPDINIKGPNGQTALFYCFIYNIPDIIINKILDLKPDVNVQDDSGDTILHYVLQFNDTFVDKILDLKPDINIQNNKGQTALMYSLTTEFISTDIINKLIDYSYSYSYSYDNLDFNLKDINGNNILMYILKYGTDNIIDKILKLNPDVNITNNIGETPLSLAKNKNHINKIMKLTGNI